MNTNRDNSNQLVHLLMALVCMITLISICNTVIATPSSYQCSDTSVKDQGIAGACWAFATYGAIESHIKVTEGFDWQTDPDFSENDLKNNHGFDMDHTQGGNIWVSAAHLSRLDAPIAEADDPYNQFSGTSTSTGPRQRFLANMYVGGVSKASIMNNGGMHVSMYWSPTYYNSTDYTYYYNGPTNVGTNHALTVVGWDDNKVTASTNPGAWLLKDSKGKSVHNNGYFWVSYDDTVACKTAAFYETVANDVINVNKAYVHDYFGRVGVSNETDAANVFTTGETPEDLVRVGIYTEGEGSYLMEVYSGNACEVGGSSTLLASKNISGLPVGYRTFDFTGNGITFQPNTTFTVMLHSLGAGGASAMAFDTAKPGYSSASTSGPGESYYFNDNLGRWEDAYSYLWPNPEIQTGTSNWCIKAFTIPEPVTLSLLVTGGLALIRRRRM